MNERSAVFTGRSDARERAILVLYEAEQRACEVGTVIAEQAPSVEDFAVEIASGVEAHRAELDALIGDHLAADWPFARMAMLDRIIAEVAVFELCHRPDIPRAVTLNEAVELAKTYSTEDSSRFLNGVLAAVATTVGV